MPTSATPPNFLDGNSEKGRRILEFDWARHPLGDCMVVFSAALLVAVRTCHFAFATRL